MNKLFLFILTMVIAWSAPAQIWKLEGKETSGMKIKLGIKAGIAIANIGIEYNQTPDPAPGKSITKLGVAGGFFARMPLSKKICFQPELLMIGKGMKEKDQYGSSYLYKTTITYLELPLNILYKPTTAKASFFIGGGPAPAFYIGNNAFYYGDGAFKTFDFGINVLAGYEIPIGFSFNLHYTHGLSNISKDQGTNGNPYSVKMKNRCFGLMIGYVF